MSRRRLSHAAQNVDAIENALDRTEIRKVYQKLVSRGRPLPRPGFFGVRPVDFMVHEIGDHPNVVFHAEDLSRSLPDKFADTRDTVGLFDGEFSDGKVRTIRTHKRNVGAVQGSDER